MGFLANYLFNLRVRYLTMDFKQSKNAKSFSELQPNSMLNEDYLIDSLQGQGRFGLVYLAKRVGDNLPVAIKEISLDLIKEKSTLSDVESALKNAQQLKHRSIIKTLDYFVYLDNFYVVMEWIDGDSLENAIRYQDLSLAKKHWFVQQLIDALGYAADHGTFHGAVSLENIMIDKFGRAVIADFGLNTLEPTEINQSNIESLVYFPPEKIKQRLNCQDHDWYSLGVVIYALFNNRMPFKVSSLNKLYESKLHLKVSKKHNKTPHLTPLIKGLLDGKSKSRLRKLSAIQPIFDECFSANYKTKRRHQLRYIGVTSVLIIGALTAAYLFAI